MIDLFGAPQTMLVMILERNLKASEDAALQGATVTIRTDAG